MPEFSQLHLWLFYWLLTLLLECSILRYRQDHKITDLSSFALMFVLCKGAFRQLESALGIRYESFLISRDFFTFLRFSYYITDITMFESIIIITYRSSMIIIHHCRINVSIFGNFTDLEFNISYAFAGLTCEEIHCHSGDIANCTFLMSNNASPITCYCDTIWGHSCDTILLLSDNLNLFPYSLQHHTVMIFCKLFYWSLRDGLERDSFHQDCCSLLCRMWQARHLDCSILLTCGLEANTHRGSGVGPEKLSLAWFFIILHTYSSP